MFLLQSIAIGSQTASVYCCFGRSRDLRAYFSVDSDDFFHRVAAPTEFPEPQSPPRGVRAGRRLFDRVDWFFSLRAAASPEQLAESIMHCRTVRRSRARRWRRVYRPQSAPVHQLLPLMRLPLPPQQPATCRLKPMTHVREMDDDENWRYRGFWRWTFMLLTKIEYNISKRSRAQISANAAIILFGLRSASLNRSVGCSLGKSFTHMCLCHQAV